MKRKPKTWIAYHLRELVSQLQDAGFDLADRIDGPLFTPPPAIENKKRVQALLAKLELKKNYPCQTCEGKGGIAVEGDTEAKVCPDCFGLEVDLDAIRKARVP